MTWTRLIISSTADDDDSNGDGGGSGNGTNKLLNTLRAFSHLILATTLRGTYYDHLFLS